MSIISIKFNFTTVNTSYIINMNVDIQLKITYVITFQNNEARKQIHTTRNINHTYVCPDNNCNINRTISAERLARAIIFLVRIARACMCAVYESLCVYTYSCADKYSRQNAYSNYTSMCSRR